MTEHKLIPESLEGKGSLFSQIPLIGELIGDKSVQDVSMAMSPAAFALILFDILAPPGFKQYTLLVAGFFVFIGLGFLLAIPNYTQLSELVRDIRNYKRRPTQIRLRNPDAHGETAVERPFYETDAKTQDLTKVKNVLPRHGAIEREDGTLVGAVQIKPKNMVTATTQDWNGVAQNYAAFLNNNLDFEIQVYGTTSHIDTDKFLDSYRERRSDSAIQQNPILSRYVDHYIDVNEELASSRYFREYYIIIPVSKFSVERENVDAGLDLTQFPVVGELLAGITDTATLSKKGTEEIRQRQLQELDDRRSVIENELVSSLEGCKSNVLSSGEYALLLKEFWQGKSMSHKEADKFIREKPLSMGSVDAMKARKTSTTQRTE
jgi:hypothetical protein